MKIAMIGLRGIPAKSGGVEHVVEHLAPLIAAAGHEVTVYCRTPYCPQQPAQYKGVKLRYFTTINTKHTETVVHSALCTFDACFANYDIVHYHAMGNGLFSLFPRIFGKKTVVTLHGLDYEREKWGRVATGFIKLNEWLVSFLPTSVISVSKKIQNRYRDAFGKEIEFIPNGIDILPRQKLGKISAELGIAPGNYILFLSRIVPEKGLHYLIDSFRKVDTGMNLVIAGDATHTDEYMEQVRKKAKGDPRIIFAGARYGDEKAQLFSNAYMFVLPSTIEGMPIVLLEAMSYGLCPLTSDIIENMDVTEGRYGKSFKSRDIKSLASEIELMIAQPEDVKKTISLYGEMLGKKP